MTVRGPKPTSEDYIQSEQAVIIWDQTHKIEHFIRQADISTKDPDLGFLVPTPDVPELVEVDSSIFQLAADVARPKLVREIVYHTPLQIFGPVLRGPAGILALPFVGLLTGMSDRDSSDEPKIVSEQDIAGYHAVILAANDAMTLALWLKQNDYEWTPEAEAWLKPYVAAKWTITAFKLIKAKPSRVAFSEESEPILSLQRTHQQTKGPRRESLRASVARRRTELRTNAGNPRRRHILARRSFLCWITETWHRHRLEGV